MITLICRKTFLFLVFIDMRWSKEKAFSYCDESLIVFCLNFEIESSMKNDLIRVSKANYPQGKYFIHNMTPDIWRQM